MQRFDDSMNASCSSRRRGMQSEDAVACDDEDPMADDEFELEMEREFQRRADDAEKMGRLSAAVASRDSSLDRDQGSY